MSNAIRPNWSLHRQTDRRAQQPGSDAPGVALTTLARFSGALDDLGVAELLQLLQLMRKSAVITVTRSGECSHLWCSEGSIIDAESGQLRGEAALFHILGFERGWLVAELRPALRTRTIFATSQHLLLEAARRKDESGASRLELDDSDVLGSAAESEPPASLSENETSLPPFVASLAAGTAAPARTSSARRWLPLALLLLVPSSYFWGVHSGRGNGSTRAAAATGSVVTAAASAATPCPVAVTAPQTVTAPAASVTPAATGAPGVPPLPASALPVAPVRAPLPPVARAAPRNRPSGSNPPQAPEPQLQVNGQQEPVVRLLD